MKISTLFLSLLLSGFGLELAGQSWENFPYPRWPESFTAMDATGKAVWLALERQGLYRYDLEQERVTDSFPMGRIRYVASVPRGGIWTWYDNTLTFSRDGQQRSWQIPPEMNVAYPVTDSTGWIGNDRNFFWFDGQGVRDSMGLGSASLGPQQTVLASTEGQLWVRTHTALLAYRPSGIDTLFFADMPLAEPGQRPDILLGKNGDLWLLFFPSETSYHLLNYHPQQGFTAYPNQPKSRWARFHLDHANRLWLEENDILRRWTPAGLVEERVLPYLRTYRGMYYPDTTGNIWQLGRLDNGLNEWVVCRTDLANDSHFRLALNQGPSAEWIRRIWSDAQGRQYFFGGNGFISRYDPRSQGWDLLFSDLWDAKHYTDWEALTIKQDPANGSLVILAQVTEGPYRDKTQRLERFFPEEDRWELIESDRYQPWFEILGLAISPQGVIAIRTWYEGYHIYRDGEFVPVGFPPRPQGQGIIEYIGMKFDGQERLWVTLKSKPQQLHASYRQYVYDLAYDEWIDATSGISGQYPHFGWQHFLFPNNHTRYCLADSAMLVQWHEAGRAYTQLIRPADFGLEAGEHFLTAELDAQQNVWLVTNRYRLLRYSCAGIMREAIPPAGLDLRLRAFHVGTDGKVFLAPRYGFVYQVFDPGESVDCAPGTDKTANQWQVSPQPATHFLVLSHPDPQAAELELRWLDLSGREVLREQVPFRFPHTRLSLHPRLSSGLYLLQITSGTESDWRRVRVVR